MPEVHRIFEISDSDPIPPSYRLNHFLHLSRSISQWSCELEFIRLASQRFISSPPPSADFLTPTNQPDGGWSWFYCFFPLKLNNTRRRRRKVRKSIPPSYSEKKGIFRLEKSCGINKSGVREKSLSYIFFELDEKSQFERIHPSMDYRKSGWRAIVQYEAAQY